MGDLWYKAEGAKHFPNRLNINNEAVRDSMANAGVSRHSNCTDSIGRRSIDSRSMGASGGPKA